MKKPSDQPLSVKCPKCAQVVQVPAGGRRLCACGTWLSGDKPPDVEVAPGGDETAGWPRIEGDLAAIERLNDGYRRITSELSKAIVGQRRVIEELLVACFARGHCLLVGVPGLAKTLLIRTLADSLVMNWGCAPGVKRVPSC